MATGVLQHRRAPSASRVLVTPADGELFVDTDTYKVYIGDNATAGGILIGVGIPQQLSTLTKTSNYSILVGDSGIHFNNIGAGGTVILTLPTATANLQFAAAVLAAQYVEFLASGTDVIYWAGTSSAAGGYVRSNVVGSFFQLEAHGSGIWIASSVLGPWSIDA